MRGSESSFDSYRSKGILLQFAYLICPSLIQLRTQSAKKTCLQFAIDNFGDELQNIFEVGLKKYGVIVEKIAV